MGRTIAYIDCEVGADDHKIKDFGAVDETERRLHTASVADFAAFVAGKEYVCGHNIAHHDLKYILPLLPHPLGATVIDTLYWSPLLFPKSPYHALLKDDKLRTNELNNPLNDALKARDLFLDELAAFDGLSPNLRTIYYHLLSTYGEFSGFFRYRGFSPGFCDLAALIREEFRGEICENADLDAMIDRQPVELAFALALIGTRSKNSITPPWLLHNYPNIENIVTKLRKVPCHHCAYCNSRLDVVQGLKRYFGFDRFRTWNGENLQEEAARAALEGKSLLAIFPTGGGKSITFQLPALMAGELVHGLTVVVSPLQSLMKDQVDNLAAKGFTEAVTINGMLTMVERKEAMERVASGGANLLYISPEQLRSKTIETLLLKRNVVRFVIDEAHCFSAWGQDFRVDYLYIGDFIKEYQQQKLNPTPVAVSCFTATAKQKVIDDIKAYFLQKLDLHLQLFATTATRENLRYRVLHKETDQDKYNELRALIADRGCPTIVYVSRTRRTQELADKLTQDGFPALPYNGKMETSAKVANQEAFVSGKVNTMVATSAFGMGVDKSDVGLVVHYDISDSLENYVQEAGRAGRDEKIQAECYVLFNDSDLDKHFILLNQTKLSIGEIQQVWSAMKYLTKFRPSICCSALEIARQAGWDDTVSDIETRVRTAVSALETAGYVKRKKNIPQVFATSIMVKNMDEAIAKINASRNYADDAQRTNAKRIIQSLISSKNTAGNRGAEAESRVDYLADTLGIRKKDVIDCINEMRNDHILDNYSDMTAFVLQNDSTKSSNLVLERFLAIENFLLQVVAEKEQTFSLKELNDAACKANVKNCSVKNIRTILYFLSIKEYIKKEERVYEQSITITPQKTQEVLYGKFQNRVSICRFVIQELYKKVPPAGHAGGSLVQVDFSLIGLLEAYNNRPLHRLYSQGSSAKQEDMEDALLYLQKIGAMKLEGGFLVIYNRMQVQRLMLDNRKKYTQDDYAQLNAYYKQKIQQIHIVGEYANLMVRDYNAALQFVSDYFNMDYRLFIRKYFKGERAAQIENNITPAKYQQLFGGLSPTQKAIIGDHESRRIVVAAGPGSGKTKVLAHKLASLLLMEDVKHEQLLLLTFSRAAATEFKKRLVELVGNAANFVEIKTFHSYSFDLMGRIGNIEDSKNIVAEAARMIDEGEVEPGRTAKNVLVIDEAQDMDAGEAALVQALMHRNEEMRVIAVGDDDQNIYQFRGSSSQHMLNLLAEPGAARYELVENFRSRPGIVALANAIAATMQGRMKNQPGVAAHTEPANVTITTHTSRHLEEAVLNHMKQTRLEGTTCVLTQTNNEAATMVALLTRHGFRAKLIQNMGSMRLANLVEVRYFCKTVENGMRSSSVITDAVWNDAKNKLQQNYASSACLDVCLKLLADFEATNTHSKYWTDFREFVTESNIEDFHTGEAGTIFVSTIHKAKGREFNNVFLLLDHPDAGSEAQKRKLYVALTRAKDHLHLHCNNAAFSTFQLEGVEQLTDYTPYSPPEEIALQLDHKGVYLDFFKGRKERIFQLRAGQHLQVCGADLTATIAGTEEPVVRLSKASMAQIEGYRQQGYTPTGATINFIVAWKGENDTEETAVVLPTVRLVRNCARK